jgi:hypothetical protein
MNCVRNTPLSVDCHLPFFTPTRFVVEVIAALQHSAACANADPWNRLKKLEPDAIFAAEIQDECGIA